MVVEYNSLVIASTWVIGLLPPGHSLGTGKNLPYRNNGCQSSFPQGQFDVFFHWYYHLAAIFVSSIGLEDIMEHIETFTKFTQQALKEGQQNLSLLNTEMFLMRKAVLQNRIALDVITASQGDTYAVI